MRVSTDHRALTQRYEPTVYRETASIVASRLGDAGVSSVILCGSTVKDDIVPGWSDLDVVVISSENWVTTAELDAAREAIEAASSHAQIGVGIDLGGRHLLTTEGRIGGRPRAMTYEVARYGEALVGGNDLLLAPPLADLAAELRVESWSGALAELHNIHRYYCTTRDDEALLRESVKSWLKILKHLVEPNTQPPFTHASYLGSLREGHLPDQLDEMLTLSVESRARYGDEEWAPEGRRETGKRLMDAFTDPLVLQQIEEVHASRR